jgi:hypothetical protein
MQKKIFFKGVIFCFVLGLGFLFIPNNLVIAQSSCSDTCTCSCNCPCSSTEPCKGGLVPCGRSCDDPCTEICECCPCTICHFFVLIKRIIDFLTTTIAFPLLALMIVVGGIMFLTSSGSEKQLTKAKEILKAAAIGILIVLCAWVIIDTVITLLTPADSPFRNWSTINCPVP